MDITVKIDGNKYSGWSSISVTRVIGEICGDFNFSLINYPLEETKNIVADKEVTISMEGPKKTDNLITGYIYDTERSDDGESSNLNFAGRDKTSDLVDSSALYKTSFWKKKELAQIVSDICEPFGIDVFAYEGNEIVKEFALQSGETAFAAIDRLCRAYTILPMTDNNGTLVLTSIADATADTKLKVGQNILSWRIQERQSERYSNYYVKGQRRGSGSQWKNDYVALVGNATDEDVPRYRPLVLCAEKHMTQGEIKKRAAWEAQVRAGRASRVQLTVLGWYQDPFNDDSRPWQVNELVNFVHEGLGINTQLVIGSVTFEISESGRITFLELYPKEIYASNPTEKIKLSRRSSVRPS